MKNLDKRKELAAKVLGVGKNKIVFDSLRLPEIKEAITKQDIRDMYAEGIISVKENRGRRKKEIRTTKKGPGKTKRKVRDKKRDYVILVRKLRGYAKELKNKGDIAPESYTELRKKIKARGFKSKAHLKEYIGGKV